METKMNRDLNILRESQYDLIVIGAGITGACVAHDASLRGLRVALLEKDDFGMSTSAASSKLLHGGIRYLQKLQFGKVRESARERCIFQVIAPHLTKYVPFLIPTVRGSLMKGRFAMKAGMILYGIACRGLNSMISDPLKKVPGGKLYNKDDACQLVPLLKNYHGMNGAQTLFESHMYNSERMTLAFVKTAVSNGADAANYVRVKKFVRDQGRVTGVSCKDMLTGEEFEVRGKVVANASGPFLPQLNASMGDLQLKKETTGFSKGVHLVTRKICDDFALAMGSGKKTEGMVTRGGRHFFVIPWRNRSLIGTTNVPFTGDIDELEVTPKDVNDFLDDINAMLPAAALKNEDIDYAFTGLYPLVSEGIKSDTYQGTGEYQVVDHSEKDGVEGVVSVLGAKYTTGRIVAQYAVDMILKKVNFPEKICQTATTPLLEGKIADLAKFTVVKKKEYGDVLEGSVVEHLIKGHGSEIDTIIAYLLSDNRFMEKIAPDRETLVGEVHYGVDKEMACKLSDVIFARTGLGTIGHPGDSVLTAVAAIMAEKLDWDSKRVAAEISSVERKYNFRDRT
jgi:glycerol-3-phosphate dehydrogenase